MIATIIKKMQYNKYKCQYSTNIFDQLLVYNGNNLTYDLEVGDKVLVISDNNDKYIIGKIDNGERSQKISTQEHQYSYNIDQSGITQGIYSGTPRQLIYKNMIEDIVHEASLLATPKQYSYRLVGSGRYVIKVTDRLLLGTSKKQIPDIPKSIFDVVGQTDFQQSIRNRMLENSIEIIPNNININSKNILLEQENINEKQSDYISEINKKDEEISELQSEIENMKQEIQELNETISNLTLSIDNIKGRLSNVDISGDIIKLNFSNIDIKQDDINISSKNIRYDASFIMYKFQSLDMNSNINITQSQVNNSLRLLQNNDIIINGRGILNSLPIARKSDPIMVYPGQQVVTPMGGGTVTSPGNGIISM